MNRLFTSIAAGVVVVGSMTACTVESPDNNSTGLGTTSTSAGDTEVVATTIPLPTATETAGDVDSSGGSTDGGTLDSSGSGSGGMDTSGSGSGDSGSSSEGGASESSSDTGEPTYDIGWCNIQFPAMVVEPVGATFTIYSRVFAEGLTDQSGVTDPAPQLVAELGWGPDGTDPSMGDADMWNWTAAGPNAGYGPGAPDYSAVNDEYWGDITIGVAGVHDFATRISGDGGATWVYCDVDGLAIGGYTPDQAGDAQIGVAAPR